MKITIRQKSGMCYLYADISVGKIRVTPTIGISVKKGDFNLKSQSVKGETEIETNLLINKFKSSILSLIRHLQLSEKLTKQNILDGVKVLKEQLTNPDYKPINPTIFTTYIQRYIDRNTGVKKLATIKQYNNSLAKLKSYEKKRKVTLTFDKIDYEFYNDFINYTTKELKLSCNSIGNIIKGIKLWMNAAQEEGLHKNMAYSSKTFKKPTESSESIYLSEEELSLIKSTNLTNRHLENVRDLFLLACYTGVRSQDYSKLDKTHLINNGSMFKVRTEKTDTEVIIPLHPIAKEILDKYDGKPRVISNQKFNEYIKIVCELAKIVEPITLTMTIGGNKVSTTKPKFKFVSSHTARRSFATNAYKAGLPTLAIMAITGHTTEKVFLKYIKVTKEEHAFLSSEHPFFANT